MNRALRLTVGLPPLLVLYLAAALAERLFDHADRAVLRLRDWMDVPR